MFKVSENLEKGDILFFNNQKKTILESFNCGHYPDGTAIEHVKIRITNCEDIFLTVGLIVKIFNTGARWTLNS
jgi:hypothetical protein